MSPRLMLATIAATLSFSSPAVVSAQIFPPSYVKVADLDLSRATDREALDARILQAAKRTCGDYIPTGTRIARFDVCLAAVREEVMDQLPPAGRQQLATTAQSAGASASR